MRAMGPCEGRGLLSHSDVSQAIPGAGRRSGTRTGRGGGSLKRARRRDAGPNTLYLSAPRKYEAPAAAEPKRQLPWPAQWREGSGKVDVCWTRHLRPSTWSSAGTASRAKRGEDQSAKGEDEAERREAKTKTPKAKTKPSEER